MFETLISFQDIQHKKEKNAAKWTSQAYKGKLSPVSNGVAEVKGKKVIMSLNEIQANVLRNRELKTMDFPA